MNKRNTTKKPDVYQIVADKIIAMLESGTAPWRKPWATTGPMSMSTNKPYRGVNIFLLMGDGSEGSNWWGTYKKVTELGGQIRKGEKSSTATYWKMLEIGDTDDNGDPVVRRIPMLRYFNVFSATQADWADGMPAAFTAVANDNDTIDTAEKVVADWKASDDAPTFSAAPSDRACYSPTSDTISMPLLTAFDTSELYYSTIFHEMTHATGHAGRLARVGVTDVHAFGSHSYGREELVAEMGAAMLAGHAGITGTLDASAAYIASWLATIRGEPKMVVQAAGDAQKAMDRILGVTWE